MLKFSFLLKMAKLYYYEILEPNLWKTSLTHAYKLQPQYSAKKLAQLALKLYAKAGGKLKVAKVSHTKGFLHRVADDLAAQYDATKDDLIRTITSARKVWDDSPKDGVLQVVQDGGKVIKTVGPQALNSALSLIKLLGTAEVVALPEEAAAAEVVAAPLEAAAPEALLAAAIII